MTQKREKNRIITRTKSYPKYEKVNTKKVNRNNIFQN